MGESIQRYDIESSESGCNWECSAELAPCRDGRAVMYEDYAKLEARVAELERELSEAHKLIFELEASIDEENC